MKQKQIVILGAGFAGVKTALQLSHDSRFKITLVSDTTTFRYYPALYHSATGGARRVSAIPLAELLAGRPVKTVLARATRLDRTKKRVATKGAGWISYDILIVALGMGTSYFGIKGLAEHSFGIKSIEEVEEFKNHLHKQLVVQGKPDSHYLVVGGGPTGVELAGMLPSYLRRISRQHGIASKKISVELIEAAPRILPRLPRAVARATARRLRQLGVVIHTKQRVEAQTADNLIVNGKPVKSQTIIWTAGLAASPFLTDNDFTMTDHHKAQVNEFLESEPDIYVLGDNADTKYSGVAQTALYDAVFVANNLQRQADNKSRLRYKPKMPVYVTPTGPSWASVVWGRFHFSGRIGWWLRRMADLIAYHDFQPWWPASQRWLALINEDEESCPVCGTAAN